MIASKPSTVLVIFLVFFILISIGLGVWGYYGYAGQEKLETATKSANNAAKAAKDFANYALYMSNEARLAIGAPGNPKDAVMTPEDAVFFDDTRKRVLDDNSAYKAEKSLEPFKKLLEALKTDLGPFDEAGKKYPTTYRERLAKENAELKNAQAQLATTQVELKGTNDKIRAQQTKEENYWKTALADIKKGNTAALKASTDRTKEMEDQFVYNKKLNEDSEELKKQFADETDAYKRKIKKLNDEIARLTDKSDGGAAVAAVRTSGEPVQALVLDVSRGRPLWDNPLGKITRVDLQNRQVYINLGSANGMKPEVTFNIFGAGANGRADLELKGTVEVIRVIDANSSLARITSIYDAEGREIALGDSTRGRPNREAQNALKEGDLLFNMFWGTRVALDGNIPFAGQISDNPAEQMRIMASFVSFLNRQGITVDAYLDLNDGQVKGTITNRTRYLIRGDDLVDPAAQNAPIKKKEVKEDDEEKKDAAPKVDVVPDRIKSINDAAAKMRQEAADKGLLVISVDNFLNVIGYRQPRSAVFGEPGGFHPSAIVASPPAGNRPAPPGQAPPPPN